jgi:hypothetical protein
MVSAYWPGVDIRLNLTYTTLHLYVLSNLTYTSFAASFKPEYTYMDIFIYIYTYTHIHTSTYIHTYIHTCIHTYIHTYIQS